MAKTKPISLAAQLLASATALAAVLKGQSLSAALTQTPAPLRPGVQALSFFALRRFGLSRALVAVLVPKPVKEPLVQGLLLLGLALLEASYAQAEKGTADAGTPIYPAHTLVDQLVSAAAAHPRSRRAKGLINATMRRFGREHPSLLAQIQDLPEVRYQHPEWWIKAVQAAWPEHWQDILQAAGQAPPMTLRSNIRRISRDELQAHLQAAGIGSSRALAQALILERPSPVQDIPGYAQGWWSVQDVSAQLAATLLPLQKNWRVLDACAAPGGKTAHMLELQQVQLTAIDNDAGRLQRVADNLQRLGLDSASNRLLCADVSQVQSWWDGQAFDAILADVPCTASGVVRRHPDIPWLRQPQDIDKMAKLQAKILAALWPCLAKGGYLLYATCSIFPQEGSLQMEKFLQRHADAVLLEYPGHILPGREQAGDGFFYALLRKGRDL